MPEQYQSALTGPQMDQALLDMANHTSERYAKGTANGAAVPSGTAGYHDNALYYKDLAANQAQTATNAAGSATNSAAAASTSEASATTAAGTATSAATTATQQATRAQNAADRAEAIVGGQFVSYGQNQSLTDAQKAIARGNIGVEAGGGGAGANLLDNAWFTPNSVVNQRGVTSGSNFADGTYRFDRWQTTFGSSASGGSWSLGTNGLTITSTTSTVFFRQKFPDPSIFTGRKITASVMLSDGSVYSGTITRTSGNQSFAHGLTGFIMMFAGDAFRFGADVGYSWTIKAIKLEVGTVSTLENDLPTDYLTELTKCQGYLRIIAVLQTFGIALSSSNIRFFYTFQRMYAAPHTVTVTTWKYYKDGSWQTSGSYSTPNKYADAIAIGMAASGGATANTMYMVQAENLIISCEL